MRNAKNQDQPASDGSGPLLQRDYWAVIENSSMGPRELIRYVRTEFVRLAPEDLVQFDRVDGSDGPLQHGEILKVNIRLGPTVNVRIGHLDENSFTIVTQKVHPEAGRITFGSYRNERGDVLFHIRSRARSRSSVHYAGFLTTGDPMQTNTWTDMIDRLAHTVGDGVIGVINAEKLVAEEHEDDRAGDQPTFTARGA